MKRRKFLQQAAGLAALGAGMRAQTGPAGVTAARGLKAAIIGHTDRGDYGHNLDVIFNDRPGIEIVALADPNEAGRLKARDRSRPRRTYADYREMLEKEHPQLVAVAPRWTDQHHAMVLAALRSGAHVYCEKPFTPTLAEADELLAVADQAGLKIAVAHQSRVAPSVLFLKKRLAEGLIGRLLEIRMHGKQDQRAGGEDLVVLGTHQLDLARFFAGDPLWCTARILHQGREATRADVRQVPDHVGPVMGDEIEAMLAFSHGVNGYFTSRAGNQESAGPYGMELVGTAGIVRMLNSFLPRLMQRHRAPMIGARQTDEWRPLEGDPTTDAPDSERTAPAGNRRAVDDWLAAIAENREPQCGGRAALKALEMIHAVFAAGLSRARVDLPLKNRQHPLGPGPGAPATRS
ncbi:MAG: Gfo/Idh/MocA family oxidoreductase [Opitutaceae bacterium]|nr:Gfo/Idh/MocA family oxidoreductase [Opitutaceae bacterium]